MDIARYALLGLPAYVKSAAAPVPAAEAKPDNAVGVMQGVGMPALVAGGLGAAAGGVSGLLSGQRRKALLQQAMLGGLAGAGAGALYGAFTRPVSVTPGGVNTPPTPPPPGASAAKPGGTSIIPAFLGGNTRPTWHPGVTPQAK